MNCLCSIYHNVFIQNTLSLTCSVLVNSVLIVCLHSCLLPLHRPYFLLEPRTVYSLTGLEVCGHYVTILRLTEL